MNSRVAGKTYEDWKVFEGAEIPSSLSTYPLLYEKIQPGMAIVDIGCGFGKTCFELIRKGYGPVVGFDINADGIKQASELVSQLPTEMRQSCRFEVRDALSTGYGDGQFDVGIMQAFMTTLSRTEHRVQVLKEVRRIIKPRGGLYMAVFMQTWHSKKMLTKYERGEIETGELGSFFAYNKETGDLEYQAHHYSERELVYLIRNANFRIESFQYHVFTTRSGNSVNGAVIWAT